MRKVVATTVSALVSIDCTGPATVAVLRRSDSTVQPLLFDDGSPLLASGVFVQEGGLLTGRDAVNASIDAPDRYIETPADLLTATTGRSGWRASPVELVSALLGRVHEYASRVEDARLTDAVIVAPSGWGPQRRHQLRLAAHQAGLLNTSIVDAATALLAHARQDGARELVLVLREQTAKTEAVVSRRTADGWQHLATHDSSDLPPSEVTADRANAVVTLASHAMRAAEVTGEQLTAVMCHAPPAQASAIAAALRDIGVSAPVRTVGDLDAAYGALALAGVQTTPMPYRRGLLGHLAAIGVPLAGAPVLLTLLLNTAMPQAPYALIPPLPRQRPPYLYTLWPAWSMIGVLVLLGALALAQLVTEARTRRAPTPDDGAGRRTLARGLRLSVTAAALAGVLAAMLGSVTFEATPIWWLLLWTFGPQCVLGALTGLVAYLIQHGHLSLIKWQIWLRFPHPAMILMAVGVLTIHTYLLMSASLRAQPSSPGLAPGVAKLGAIALGLATTAILIRQPLRQMIASPLVITAVLITYSYTNLAMLIAITLVAVTVWWALRAWPAAAFANVYHPATRLAATFEPADRT